MLPDLDQIKQSWVAPHRDPAASRTWWDEHATYDHYKELPHRDNNAFLQLLYSEGMVQPSYDILDVGCGSGVYSLALAPDVHSVTGVDLSPVMISNARKLEKETGTTNASFQEVDWHELTLADADWEGSFDLVFAHLTPAVMDASHLEKLDQASRHYCAIARPARRTDELWETVDRLAGRRPMISKADNGVRLTFAMLWEMGYFPKLHYELQTWPHDESLERTLTFQLKRLQVDRELSSSEEAAVTDYLKSLVGPDGLIHSASHTWVTTVYWDKQQRV